MPAEQLTVTTRDGLCPGQLFTPARADGPWPAVILYMDAGGIRPALATLAILATLADLARGLADAGYAVLLPDLFYRQGA